MLFKFFFFIYNFLFINAQIYSAENHTVYSIEIISKIRKAIDQCDTKTLNELITQNPRLITEKLPLTRTASHTMLKYAIMVLFMKGYDLIKFLLDNGANKVINKDERNCLMLAVNNGDLDLIELLLSYGADPNKLTYYDYNGNKGISLHGVVNYDIALILLLNGADLNIQSSIKQTPLEKLISDNLHAKNEIKDYKKIKFLYENWQEYGQQYKKYLKNYRFNLMYQQLSTLYADKITEIPNVLNSLIAQYAVEQRIILNYVPSALTFNEFMRNNIKTNCILQ
jgi:hypothetical protein